MKYRFPVNFIGITQAYKKGVHLGLDLGWNSNYGGKNQPIYAASNGKVIQVKDNDKTGKSWGNLVKIDHGNNNYTLYAHLKEGVVAKKGQQVKTGDLIGYMGTTGHSAGNHLHYEVYVGGAGTGYRVDPLKYTGYTDDQVIAKSTQKEYNLSKYVEDPVEIKYNLTRLLKINCKGNDVKKLQETLISLGYSIGKADSNFGAKTKKGVLTFQKANGLTSDGIVGVNTAHKLGWTYQDK